MCAWARQPRESGDLRAMRLGSDVHADDSRRPVHRRLGFVTVMGCLVRTCTWALGIGQCAGGLGSHVPGDGMGSLRGCDGSGSGVHRWRLRGREVQGSSGRVDDSMNRNMIQDGRSE